MFSIYIVNILSMIQKSVCLFYIKCILKNEILFYILALVFYYIIILIFKENTLKIHLFIIILR